MLVYLFESARVELAQPARDISRTRLASLLEVWGEGLDGWGGAPHVLSFEANDVRCPHHPIPTA